MALDPLLNYTHNAETGRVTDAHLAGQIAFPQIEDVSYRYDATGNITRSVDTQGDPGAGDPAETECYRYNPLDELIAAWSATDQCAANLAVNGATAATVGGPQPYWTTWAINAADERTNQTQHAVPSGASSDATTTYSNGVTGHIHALATTSVTQSGQSGGTTYSYYANGATQSRTLASGGEQKFVYTAQGRTASITTSAGPISYIYDADGRELVRNDPASTTLYLPGEELTRDTSSGAITGTRYYTHNGSTAAVRVALTGLSYLFSDPHGTTTTAMNVGSSNAIIRRHFDPYGNDLLGANGSTTTGAAWPDNHAFLNRPTDTTTGLDDLGAREYDPSTGRFLSVDPLLTPADPKSLNGYGYADNNAIDASDPTGLSCIPDEPCNDNATSPGPVSHYRDTTYNTESNEEIAADNEPAVQLSPHVYITAAQAAAAPAQSRAFEKHFAFYVHSLNADLGHYQKYPYAQSLTESYVWASFCNTAGASLCGFSLSTKWNQVYRSIAALPSEVQYQGLAEPGSGIQSVEGVGLEDLSLSVGGGADAFPAIKPGSADGPTAGQRFPNSIKAQALEENGDTCVYCHMETDSPQVDHSIPRSRGGDATIENAQTTCAHCNASKGARDFPVTPPEGYEGEWPPPWFSLEGD